MVVLAFSATLAVSPLMLVSALVTRPVRLLTSVLVALVATLAVSPDMPTSAVVTRAVSDPSSAI